MNVSAVCRKKILSVCIEKDMSDLYGKTEYALELISQGDEDGVRLLYDAMAKTMFFVARNIVGDAATAEDVVQSSFVLIVKNISRYKKGTNGYGWICKIVRNTALNALCSAKRHPTENIGEFAGAFSEDNVEEKSVTHLLVEKLMNSLSPPVVKQMIYMKYFLDMTVREIACEIGKSKSYVAREIKKAEEKMKKILEK